VENDVVENYCLRQPDQKRKSVEAFRSLNFKIIAAGDSYNDTTMLGAADHGILFRSPDNVKAEFPQFPAVEEYADLMALIDERL
jgi:phosphoserine/homoserine phosphotransferase